MRNLMRNLLTGGDSASKIPPRAAAAAVIARAISAMPPHQRHSLSSSSEELTSIYGSRPRGQVVEELEEEFYEEEFDPVRHFLEHIPYEEVEVAYFEEKAALRLAQLDKISERLSRHVMENHEEMVCGGYETPWIYPGLGKLYTVKGMHLVRELEKDLKVANVICMNGRRHLNSSRNEVSRDLIVTTNSRRKQALLDMLPVLAELRHALDMQVALEVHVEEGDFCKAFQVVPEYLQVLDSFSELSAIQEMSHVVEFWLGKTLQKLDSLLLGVCQDFKEESYITVVDAYALIGDVSGLAEKMQSFFMQEVLSVTHTVLKNIIQEDMESPDMQSSRLTYSDLCIRIPESKFRHCLLETLAVLFKLMCSYYAIMSFKPENKDSTCQTLTMKQKQDKVCGYSGDVQHVNLVKNSYISQEDDGPLSESIDRSPILTLIGEPTTTTAPLSDATLKTGPMYIDYYDSEARDGGTEASSSESPWFQLRNDAATFVSQTLRRGRKNLWQLATSRVSVLLSSAAVCSTSLHQFLKNYEDLNIFILAGEAFCGVEAVEFRQKVKAICENYFAAFHRQNVYALKMVIEKEHWLIMPPDTVQVVSFAGLVGDGAALITPSGNSSSARVLHSNKSAVSVETTSKKSGFSDWLKTGNPFLLKLSCTSKEVHDSLLQNGSASSGEPDGNKTSPNNKASSPIRGATHVNDNMDPEDENEDLHADFIDEDSQLPSRISKPRHSRNHYSHSNNDEMMQQTGSSLCLLRLMDKYARLMQKLEIINVEFFKGICQLFGIFFYFVYESFGQQSTNPTGKGLPDTLNYRLKTALSRITQDCDRWIKSQSTASPTSLNMPFTHMDVIPASPPSTNFSYLPHTSFGLKERCASADTISLVARLLHRSKAHLQSMLLQNNAAIVEDFYVHVVDSVPDLTEHIHRTTARLLLHINGYVDRIANAKWEVKELGLEHNGYVDLLLGEFKHYKTRLAHGGIQKEVQDLLLVYGLENLAEVFIEGLSQVKRCTDEGRVLMSLDLQVLINGLLHFVSINVKPKLQIVEAFIKAYYLPETEYVHWARAHPEYRKSQTVGLVNLVATMKGWKRKNRLEVIEKIEAVNL